jgi:hypothetical protein
VRRRDVDFCKLWNLGRISYGLAQSAPEMTGVGAWAGFATRPKHGRVSETSAQGEMRVDVAADHCVIRLRATKRGPT